MGEERDQYWSIVILGSEGGELPSGPHNISSIIIVTMRMLMRIMVIVIVMTTMFMMLMMMVFEIFLGQWAFLPFFIRKCEASQSNSKYIDRT